MTGTPCPAGKATQKNKRDSSPASDLQIAQVRNAGFHHVEVHFYEVVLDAGGFCRREDFLPIQGVLTDRHDLFSLRGPALYMHGDEAPWILGEIFGGIVAAADCRDLKLKFDQFRIEKIEEHIIGSLAIDRCKLEVFVVKSLLDASLGR